ncbi:hypothetical protein [Lagierella sp.]|uniref:hypothetical protein n=1 Tax=Lagierella sp. TaxID=2849657 RepID=UPI00262FC36D|nr:hypothetical protein [Lagierella sp.]
MKKKNIKWIILILLAIPILFKVVIVGIGEFEKSKKKDEDTNIYLVGDTIKNDIFQMTIDKIVVSKTPEDIVGIKEYFNEHGKVVNPYDPHSKKIPIEVSDDGVLENDVSYLKLYLTGENIGGDPVEGINLGSSLIGGGEPITGTILFSDKVAGKNMEFNNHTFKKGEKKEVVTSFVVWDKDLEQFKDSLYWRVDFPKGKAEKEPLARNIQITID